MMWNGSSKMHWQHKNHGERESDQGRVPMKDFITYYCFKKGTYCKCVCICVTIIVREEVMNIKENMDSGEVS